MEIEGFQILANFKNHPHKNNNWLDMKIWYFRFCYNKKICTWLICWLAFKISTLNSKLRAISLFRKLAKIAFISSVKNWALSLASKKRTSKFWLVISVRSRFESRASLKVSLTRWLKSWTTRPRMQKISYISVFFSGNWMFLCFWNINYLKRISGSLLRTMLSSDNKLCAIERTTLVTATG